MTCHVLVEQKGERNFTAAVLGWPDSMVRGDTREQVLDRVRQAMINRLAHSEIISLELVPSTKEHPSSAEHPWLKYAGAFKDNPVFNDVLADIEHYRRELDMDADTV